VSGLEPHPSSRRRARRRRWPRLLAAVLVGALLFVVGVAFGMALRDDPEPGGTVTLVRTLEPLPQVPTTTP
jgi:hypothetical protein